MTVEDAEIDPERDLLERYDEMVLIQIETIDGIDEKAASVSRLVGLLGGLVLTAVSVAATVELVALSETTAVAFSMLGAGIVALFVSLVFAIITYLSSKFRYGPTADLGEFVADHPVDRHEYREFLLRTYSSALRENKRVVDTNATRFKWCLASLLAGLIFLFAAGILFVIPTTFKYEIIFLLIITGKTVVLTTYIAREEYLTLDR